MTQLIRGMDAKIQQLRSMVIFYLVTVKGENFSSSHSITLQVFVIDRFK